MKKKNINFFLLFIASLVAIFCFIGSPYMILGCFAAGFLAGRFSHSPKIETKPSRIKLLPEFPTEDRF